MWVGNAWSAKSGRGPKGGSTERTGTGDPLPLPASWGKGKTLDQTGKWNILEGPTTGVA